METNSQSVVGRLVRPSLLFRESFFSRRFKDSIGLVVKVYTIRKDKTHYDILFGEKIIPRSYYNVERFWRIWEEVTATNH